MFSSFCSGRAFRARFAYTSIRILPKAPPTPTLLLHLAPLHKSSSRSSSSSTPGAQNDNVNKPTKDEKKKTHKIAPPPLKSNELRAIGHHDLRSTIKLAKRFLVGSLIPTGIPPEELRDAIKEAFSSDDSSEIAVDIRQIMQIFESGDAERLPSRLHAQSLAEDVKQFSGSLYVERVRKLTDFLYAILHSPDEEIWASLYDLVSLQSQVNQSTINGLSELKNAIANLRSAWNNPFCGLSLAALKQTILNYETTSARVNYYAKVIPIIQSSGTGKSRLIDEIGKTHLCVSFVLRENGESGYPPGDPEITKFLKEALQRPDDMLLAYSHMLAFLSGLFTYLIDWVKLQDGTKNEECLAKLWHDMMVPRKKVQDLQYEKDLSDIISQTRSPERKEFCQKVVQNARANLSQLQEDDEWRTFFGAEVNFSQFGQLQAVQTLVSMVAEFFEILHNKIGLGALFLISLDEVSHLYHKEGGNLYPALRHLLYELREFAMWTFTLSTQSSIEILAQPKLQDPSTRVLSGALKRYDPFLGLDSNLGIAMNLAKDREAIFRKPLSQFSTAKHMTLFGRPLWEIYMNRESSLLRRTVLEKLFGNGAVGFYKYWDMDHAFAALASRISLDPCTRIVESSTSNLSQKAVKSYLRLVVDMDYESRRFVTRTPCEPLVSDAVAWILTQHTSRGNTNWYHTIQTLTDNLLYPGLVEKGLKGELYIRLLLVLARDLMLSTRASSSHFPYSEPFKMIDYLGSLFSPDLFQQIKDIVPDEATNIQLQTKLSDAFSDGWCNFTHFVNTENTIIPNPGNLRELLHLCMMQHAALQCAFHQQGWDIIIPVYLGDPQKDFDRNNISAILIQVKCQQKMMRLDLENEKLKFLHQQYFGNSWHQPILSILLNVGPAPANCVSPSNSLNHNLYGFTVSGAGSAVYGSKIDPKHHTACNVLLDEVRRTRLGDTIHDRICKRNTPFLYHSFEECFSSS